MNIKTFIEYLFWTADDKGRAEIDELILYIPYDIVDKLNDKQFSFTAIGRQQLRKKHSKRLISEKIIFEELWKYEFN